MSIETNRCPSVRHRGSVGDLLMSGVGAEDSGCCSRLADDVELLAAVHELVDQVVRDAGSVPEVGSAAWWAAAASAQVAALLVLAEAWLVHDPDRAVAERLKAAAVAISGELARERELIHRRREEIGAALRRGDSRRAIELTAHHASDRWAEEVA